MSHRSFGPGEALSVEAVRSVQLEILDAFQRWAQKRGLQYMAAYGTLLGARRHGGFIPWDDDIDIMMPRNDYERLRQHLHIGDFVVGGAVGDDNFPYANVKIFDPATVVSNDGFYDVGIGLGIDIFPIDGAPRGASGLRQKNHLSTIRGLLALQSLTRRPGRSLIKSTIAYVAAPLARCLSRRALLKSFSLVAQGHPDAVSRGILVGSYQWSVSGEFLNVGADLGFEGRSLPGPFSVHEVLVAKYGRRYMTPPPAEEQRSHHTFVAYRR